MPQLHAFLASVGAKVSQEDKQKVYEAVAHVISAMPMEQAAQSLRTFALDLLAKIHSVATEPNTASKQELQDVAGELVRLLCF